jgi:hypothetical protein
LRCSCGGPDDAPGVEGPSGGADWQIVRADGAVILEARYCVRTANGALVFWRR